MQAEGHGRTAFAEVAEALEISTLDVVGTVENPFEKAITVFFTEGVEDVKDDVLAMGRLEVLAAKLARDADGVLVRCGDPIVRGTLADLIREAGF